MHRQRGQILIIVNILTSVLLLYSLALVNLTLTARNIEKNDDSKIISTNIAEAGIEKAVWCFNQIEGSNCGGTYGTSYAGEMDVIFEEGIYDITITSIDSNTKQIEATGYYPNKATILSKSIIRTRIATDADRASFIYGAQVGEGGLQMDNNSIINGSVYSNGNIIGTSNSQITGDAYVAGGTALVADQEHTTYNDDFIFGKTNPQVDIAQSFIPGTTDVLNKVSIYIKKISSPSNINVRILNDNGGLPGSVTLASATLSSSLVSTNYGWISVSFTSPPSLTAGTTYWLLLNTSKSSTKYWLIGADAFDGYTAGTMVYSQDWDNEPWYSSGYDINFKTWMGGVITKIDSTHIGGNAYAYRIEDSIVAGNAEGYEIDGCTIGQNALSNSIINSTIGWNATSTDIQSSTVGHNLWCDTYSDTDIGLTNFCPTSIIPPEVPGPTDLAISDALINDWKTDAENGGIIEGNKIFDTNTSLGPVKINGNMIVDGGVTLTITGAIYVTGNIIFNNNAILQLSSSYGSNSGIIINDDTITINNNVIFDGAETGSYILLLSTYENQTITAIQVNNNSTSAIISAPYGIIEVMNNAVLKQVEAHLLKLSNGAIIQYETGLADIIFSSGPSGGWSKIKGTWQIIE